ncbi:efflux RND transporter periplasmic adaptor subunit [Methylococcus mesophilus]|uniref:efflux RND transporter periplasmic adaptor subunit n=1 Tax=Methylococcus mesophilus TaxID=2993564 RepID=UPI00224A537E|nr:efflux RND transporter periplasmic adaptor subunit [Methylococcus mesophilus]UZR28967.1 efflux RND transporter periplasmic adaptor subunit [Methylococcus mesophilus]
MTHHPQNSPDALQTILDAAPKRRSRHWWRLAVVAVALLLLARLLIPGGSEAGGRYLTEEAAIADLVVTVSASGTLEPTTSVDVGSEMSGTMAEVLVQENDRVRKGQLLARLDLAKLSDSVIRSKASLTAAEASVAQSRATLAEARAALSRMRHVAETSGGKVPAKTELETAEATLQRAIANEANARAAVVQAQAAVKTDETNLAKGTIRSPVDGVVLARKIEPGQTVVSAMTIPVLFTLAEDLTQMELQVKVDEADVGNVKVGQPATFTVSAWPGRNFPASIQRVGLGSTITDNVVTYKTVLEVRNNDLALRPGMTATASIVTARRENVLLVPNAALRFTPPEASEPKRTGGIVNRLLPRPPAEPKKRNGTTKSGAPQVWVLDNQQPKAVPVKTGVSDGRWTEIVGGDIKPGMAVITEYQEAKP